MNKAGSLFYYASVVSALPAFENLPSYNVTVEDDFVYITEGQLVEVPINDISAIPEIYNVIRESSPNLVVAMTGKSCSYSSSERIKRAADDSPKAEPAPFIVRPEDKILFYADKTPVLKVRRSISVKNF